MENTKELVVSAINRAQSDLEAALLELAKIPAFDPGTVAFAAHKINNYLNVINGAIELIAMQLSDYHDDQIKTWLEGMQHATSLMAGAVAEMMNNTRENKEHEFRKEKVDFPTLVKRCCYFYQRVANRKSIKVSSEIIGDVPAVFTDRAATAAVLDNLLSNAVKFSHPGKKIQVRVLTEGKWAVCEVRDEGPGLSAEDQTRLFMKGARLTPRPTGGEASSGYGLAVARELVEKMGGKIWYKSVDGRGSSFTFRLPLSNDFDN